jgi:hypothetical protein
MIFSVTQNGRELDKSKYTWDESTKTFSTNENNLALDFFNLNSVTFKTGDHCTFNTGYNCTFNTGSNCTFNTGWSCTFKTGSHCTFNTGYNCTFNTGSNCTFNTGWSCTFKTGSHCTFKTGYNCTFKTGDNCTFEVSEKCCLHYCWNDYFEVYKLEPNKLIKILLNGQLEYIQKKTETQIQIEKLEHELQILKEKYLKEQK